MAPALLTTLRRVVSATPPSLDIRSSDGLGSSGGPLLEARKLLAARERQTPSVDPGAGTLDPHDINNAGFFALFAIIGVAAVVTGIWFFFWAKNGGFHFKENDWDDYKSTVLRRRGPNGTLLSGATPTTDLGGGSVYKDVDDDNTTVVTESTLLSGITAGASDIFAREKRRKKQEKRERERAKKNAKKNRHVGEDGVEDVDAEKSAKKELRNYRHEKVARVGGLNRESDASTWDGSTNPTESTVDSELLSNRQSTPTTTPTKSKYTDGSSVASPSVASPSKALHVGGIRKVYSVADRRAEAERLRAEARRQREEGRPTRNFSYQRAESYTRPATSVLTSEVTESLLEGSSVTGTESDMGTKSYHHPMPELREMERQREREERKREREERRAARGGYRRGRTEDY